ncbi:MAG: MATE family efflux transporter [SAR324 cluster bacterium]|nr:MATE family efflux transporter [SAR324 cluster bacterium]MBL7035415.1 MATE family efflux transporter [SAR324 cluster bacterium]
MKQSILLTRITKFLQESAQTLKLGLPVIIAQLLQTLMQFVDTVMAGHVSSQDLAGLAIATALYHPVFLLMLGILIALGSIVAQLYGAEKPAEIMQNVIQGLWLSLVLAMLSIVILANPEFILHAMGYEEKVSQVAGDYLKALCWGMPAVYAYLVLRMFNEGLSVTRPNMYLSLLGLGINIVGNYALMFGHFGFPALGAVGAGWTTSMVHWFMFSAMLIFCLRASLFESYRKFLSFSWPNWFNLREILRIGLPSGFSLAAEVGLFAVVSLLMATFGVTAIAGHQVAINVASITFMVPLGLSMAITIRVGQAKGRGHFQEARYIGYAGILLCILVMSITALTFIIFPKLIVGLYTNDEAVRILAVQLLYMAAVFQLSDGMQVGAMGALRGLKDTRVPLIANLFAYWGFGLPLAYLIGISYNYGPVGMWGGLIAGLSIAAVFHTWRFRILSRRFLIVSPSI